MFSDAPAEGAKKPPMQGFSFFNKPMMKAEIFVSAYR
nr:MAG TPA: hypothetical protein [Caudoviricetes sp.]